MKSGLRGAMDDAEAALWRAHHLASDRDVRDRLMQSLRDLQASRVALARARSDIR